MSIFTSPNHFGYMDTETDSNPNPNPKTDVTPAILSHECATLSRDKLADAATVELHALSRKHTRRLHHFSRFTILLHN